MSKQKQNPRKVAARRLQSQKPQRPQTTAQQAAAQNPPAPQSPPPVETPAETTNTLNQMEMPQVQPPEEEVAQEDFSPIEKVKLMNALATAAEDETLAARFAEMDQGELIYNLFVGAINRQLELLMNGEVQEQDEEFAHVYNVAQDCGYIRHTMTELQRLVHGFMGTPLVAVLNELNTNLGGQKWAPQGSQGNLPGPTQQQYPNQGGYPPPQGQYPNQGYHSPPQGGYPPNVHQRPPQQPTQTEDEQQRGGGGIASY